MDLSETVREEAKEATMKFDGNNNIEVKIEPEDISAMIGEPQQPYSVFQMKSEPMEIKSEVNEEHFKFIEIKTENI
jgi:hypothetical protein